MEVRIKGKNLPVTDALHEHAPVSYTHLRAHETVLDLVCRLLLEKKKNAHTQQKQPYTNTLTYHSNLQRHTYNAITNYNNILTTR